MVCAADRNFRLRSGTAGLVPALFSRKMRRSVSFLGRAGPPELRTKRLMRKSRNSGLNGSSPYSLAHRRQKHVLLRQLGSVAEQRRSGNRRLQTSSGIDSSSDRAESFCVSSGSREKTSSQIIEISFSDCWRISFRSSERLSLSLGSLLGHLADELQGRDPAVRPVAVFGISVF